MSARVPAEAEVVASLRRLTRPAAGPGSGSGPLEVCELCGTPLAESHRHLLHLGERRILCACATCWAQRSGDPELRPAGSRVAWLEAFELPDEIWAKLQIPIGLAFFMLSSASESVVAMYPSPAGATESELDLAAWRELEALNPVLSTLEPDAEALVVNRIAEPPEQLIAPIDDCYGLVGAIKASWEGISGGPALERELPAFFAEMRRRAGAGAG